MPGQSAGAQIGQKGPVFGVQQRLDLVPASFRLLHIDSCALIVLFGAAIGAFGALAGADRLAKVEILGQPLGGFELRVGPITDPNLPWVILGRALLLQLLLPELKFLWNGRQNLKNAGAL